LDGVQIQLYNIASLTTGIEFGMAVCTSDSIIDVIPIFYTYSLHV